MLHGIGGCTVAEAKERISHAEAMAWFAYMEKHGGLDLGPRIEFGLARLMALMVNRTGGWKGNPAKVDDFLLKRAQAENDGEQSASLDDLAKIMGAKPRTKNGSK